MNEWMRMRRMRTWTRTPEPQKQLKIHNRNFVFAFVTCDIFSIQMFISYIQLHIHDPWTMIHLLFTRLFVCWHIQCYVFYRIWLFGCIYIQAIDTPSNTMHRHRNIDLTIHTHTHTDVLHIAQTPQDLLCIQFMYIHIGYNTMYAPLTLTTLFKYWVDIFYVDTTLFGYANKSQASDWWLTGWCMVHNPNNIIKALTRLTRSFSYHNTYSCIHIYSYDVVCNL